MGGNAAYWIITIIEDKEKLELVQDEICGCRLQAHVTASLYQVPAAILI